MVERAVHPIRDEVGEHDRDGGLESDGHALDRERRETREAAHDGDERKPRDDGGDGGGERERTPQRARERPVREVDGMAAIEERPSMGPGRP